jgi:hypothetical protein
MLEILEKINKQALEEIEKYQRLVRKKNIKAKKKLIGRGVAGAKSGLGPMEQTEVSERALEEGRAKPKRRYRQDKEYDLKQLEIGTDIEMEHEKNVSDEDLARKKAEQTAKDHLDELPTYYKKLKKYIEK